MKQGKRNCVDGAALPLRSGLNGAKERLACWPWLQQATHYLDYKQLASFG